MHLFCSFDEQICESSGKGDWLRHTVTFPSWLQRCKEGERVDGQFLVSSFLLARNRVTSFRSTAISPSNAGLATMEDGVLFTRVATTAAETTTCKEAPTPRRPSPPCVRATLTNGWPSTCWSVCHQTQNLSPRSCWPVTKTTWTWVSFRLSCCVLAGIGLQCCLSIVHCSLRSEI